MSLVRGAVFAVVLAVFQGSTPLLLCLIQVGQPAYLSGSQFHADRLDGWGYCGNHLAAFWSWGQATAFAVVLGLVAGATVASIEPIIRHRFGRSRRGLVVALLVPVALLASAVANFFYAAHVIESRSITAALDACWQFGDLFSGFYGITWIALAYAAFLALVVVSEWQRRDDRFVIVGCAALVALAGAVEGRHVALAAAITSVGLLVSRRLTSSRPSPAPPSRAPSWPGAPREPLLRRPSSSASAEA